MTGQGFALVYVPWFFDDDLFLRLRRRQTVLSFHCPRWRQLPQLARYACWLESVLTGALPEEAVSLAALEFRHEDAGSADAVVDHLHADGSYVRAVFTLYGPSTVYLDGVDERSVPGGQTLLMTAFGRARALRVPSTLHRRPGPGPERAVIVCSFEPRRERPRLENVYRQVAQTATQRPRRASGRKNRRASADELAGSGARD
jgi:hypothetical protein